MAYLIGATARQGDPLPPVTAPAIKLEAQRRIIALCGAVDFNACMVKQMNALMRVGELNNKLAFGQELSPSEQAEASALQSLAAQVKAIRVASNALELTLPSDFSADAHWP